MASRYDKLHDKYHNLRTTKSGTRYEILAAFVFKILDESNCVIHDLKLTGESEVKHQIDVHIEKQDGTHRKMLIECKDFDISGDKVGLDIVRNFWAVVDDTKPDLSMIITCNGFTRDALKFAKAKAIKLAVLREFRSEDLKGRILTIGVTTHIFSITDPQTTLFIEDESFAEKLQNDLKEIGSNINGFAKGQPVFLNIGQNRIQILDFVMEKANSYPRDKAGQVNYKIPMEGNTIEIEKRGGIPLETIQIDFEIIHEQEYFEVTSKKIAKLILEDQYSDADIIFFENDLQRMNIDAESGEIKS